MIWDIGDMKRHHHQRVTMWNIHEERPEETNIQADPSQITDCNVQKHPGNEHIIPYTTESQTCAWRSGGTRQGRGWPFAISKWRSRCPKKGRSHLFFSTLFDCCRYAVTHMTNCSTPRINPCFSLLPYLKRVQPLLELFINYNFRFLSPFPPIPSSVYILVILLSLFYPPCMNISWCCRHTAMPLQTWLDCFSLLPHLKRLRFWPELFINF